MASKEAALARVIESSAPQSTPKRMRTADEWIPQLQKWDQEFLELPWEARQLIFTYSEPDDIKALCSASKLFNEYCKSPNLDDFWKKKVAVIFELQRVRDAGLKFKKAKLAWAQDWVLLKPIAQWSLDDFNALFAEGSWDPLWGPRPANVVSWMHAWVNADKVASKINSRDFLKFLAKGYYHESSLEPFQYDRPEAFRGLFLRAEVISKTRMQKGYYPQDYIENVMRHEMILEKIMDDKLFLLSEWNFEDPIFGKVVSFHSPLEADYYYNQFGEDRPEFFIGYKNRTGTVELFLSNAWFVEKASIIVHSETVDAGLVFGTGISLNERTSLGDLYRDGLLAAPPRDDVLIGEIPKETVPILLTNPSRVLPEGLRRLFEEEDVPSYERYQRFFEDEQ